MKVAAVQMDVKILENERNLAKVLDHLERAAGDGADLVVFPECALSGYCFTSREEALPAAEPDSRPFHGKAGRCGQAPESISGGRHDGACGRQSF